MSRSKRSQDQVMNVEPLQDLDDEIMKKAVHFFEPKKTGENSWLGRKPSSISRERDPFFHEMYYWLGKDGNVTATIKDEKGKVVRTIEADGSRGLNTLKWDLEVDRDIALAQRLEAAKKELEKAEKQLADAKKKPEKTKKEEKKEKEESTDGKKKESDDEEKKDIEKAPEKTEEEKKKETETKIRKAVAAIEKARLNVKSIQETIDEPEKYADAPESVRKQMVRKTYVSKGKYEIEIRSGKATDTKTLEITEGDSGGSRRGRDAGHEEKFEGYGDLDD